LNFLYWIVGCGYLASRFRILCFSIPYISTLAKRQWSLERLDSEIELFMVCPTWRSSESGTLRTFVGRSLVWK
jgi:hypothetical protein